MTETYYPVTYQPDRLPRKKSSRYGFGTNPIIFLSPNRQHKLSQEEYESISALPRYQTMVEQGAIVEGSPITIEAKKEEKKATKKKTLNKNNLFDDLTGFSLTQAKKEVSKEESIDKLKLWLAVEKQADQQRASLVTQLETKIKSLEDKE